MLKTSRPATNRRSTPHPTVFVALLRGVNVGGNNMISMRELKTSFESMGFTQVTTYINSGNIIFTAKETDARQLETKIERMLAKEYDLNSKVVIRTLSEMEDLVQALPRSWSGDADWRYNVIFLRHTIDSEEIVGDLPAKSDIEEVVYRPGALLWSARVSDINRTKWAKFGTQKKYQDTTVRNLNTTKKLYELMKKTAEA
jgi:uncharacterized protein (DUF1697 family)